MNNEIEALKALLAEASERIAKLEAAEKAAPPAWPQYDDTYWFIGDGLFVLTSHWADDRVDQARMAVGNVFRTESEAKQEVERRKTLTELRKLAKESWDGGGPDWTASGLGKWRLYYDHVCGIWKVIGNSQDQNLGAVYFVSEKAAKDAIETIGAYRLMLLLEG